MPANDDSQSKAIGGIDPHEPTVTFQDDEGGPAADGAGPGLPERIGRYRVEKVLGKGGFGLVYLAYDDQLQRPVAIKVPHAKLVAQAADAEAYLSEARTVASLDHPHIVPVHDVGSTDQFPCFVVSKFIDGTDLATRLKQSRLSLHEAVELVATVAEALHHAHKQGLVHRDIKPGNILLDKIGHSFVTDFGLALRERDVGQGLRYAGTPPYMSPEQARGEGHRVDGRSDIFSIGVVLYELLVGRRPFKADSQQELLEQITGLEARPPRQIDDTIPKELDRICLKALSKRASERYSAATDMAEDLRHFLAAAAAGEKPTLTEHQRSKADVETIMPTPTTALGSDSKPIKIVPKGLRSFDEHDADFFLELLPGPRDRDGLPDSIRFWKTRIEETDAEKTFAVGLIYGPSGCGKSSLVKAGLLPRLAKSVTVIYVEAIADESEVRLLKGLRRHVPELPANVGLIESLTALRRGSLLESGQKVLLVLDQFEQWLHAKREEQNTELVQALRQCDGGRVQFLVMVRDDFWLAVSRFMGELETELIQGRNMALVDLFDPRHAKKVLATFGRAFGALPERSDALDKEQEAFLDQAVVGLSQDGKIVSVRLALFAEMVKGRPWTPATLKAVGGMKGVGVTFLEETFAAATATPQHRLHQRAAKSVLKALLPESGTDIKGSMRPRHELLTAAGYVARPRNFDTLLRILDGELRLITPTDPEGMDSESEPGTTSSGERYYQLTHDYLVHSLRDWLTRKQKETRRGRAELLLADRAVVWNARSENRQLPSLLQWGSIRLMTPKKSWTPPQRKMMRRASRYHLARGLAFVAGLLLFVGIGWEFRGRFRTQALLDNLLRAPTEDVPAVVTDMASYRRWLDVPLRQAYAEAEASGDARKQLHASLALVPVDPGQVDFLYGRLLTAEPHEVTAIRAVLRPHAGPLVERLWAVLQDQKAESGQRLRAAAALAVYAEDDPRWAGVSGTLTSILAAENAFVIARWAEALQPLRRSLLPPLADLLLAEGLDAAQRRAITSLYAGYGADQPEAYVGLEKTLAEESKPDAPAAENLALARRQANAAVALAAMGRWEKVQPLLRHRPDPTVRSYLIDRLAAGGVEAKALTALLGPEQEVSVRRAAILALGEYGQDGAPLPEREGWGPRLVEWYRNDPDPGVHGAVGWLLRQWGQQGKVQEIDQASRKRPPAEGRRWYVNGQGQTMVLVPPGEFSMGDGKKRVQRRIEHTFALAAHEVTVAEFRRFREKHDYNKLSARTEDCPVNQVEWYDAAAYCNWLSQEEGIPEDQWCYAKNDKGEYAEGIQVPADCLRRTGYRLPTEAEWEYACRAGSVMTWPHGEAEDLLGKYAWFVGNSATRSHPVGELRPNDLGLADVLGNAWEWCQDRFGKLKEEEQKDDKQDVIDDKSSRLLRSASFYSLPLNVRSANRRYNVPSFHDHDFGFRPARTLR